MVTTPVGYGLDFDGESGGVSIQDVPAHRLAERFSISAWVFLRRHVTIGPGAQILFRGDDRNGLDPYHLTISPDGAVVLGIEDGKGGGDWVSAPVPLRRWFHVLGSLDAHAGQLLLYIDGVLMGKKSTSIRPMKRLDVTSAPGIGIGNVQSPDRGVHRQPLDGILADVRLYAHTLKPIDVDYVRERWQGTGPKR